MTDFKKELADSFTKFTQACGKSNVSQELAKFWVKEAKRREREAIIAMIMDLPIGKNLGDIVIRDLIVRKIRARGEDGTP